MADPTDYEETMPGVEVPADDAPLVDAEQPEELVAEVAEPAPAVEEPQESQAVIQAREIAALRQYMTMLEQQVRAGQQAPPVPQAEPDFFQHMSAEQKQAWNASVKELRPVLDYQAQQLRREFDQRLRQSDTRGEVAEMRAEYGDDFRANEQQLLSVRQQIAAQGGGWLPLGDLYLHLKGQQAVQSQRTQRNQATQQRRKPSAQAARPVGAAPAGMRTPPPSGSAISDEEYMDQMARQTGIPRLKISKRA
jgi:hypothetical protein